MTQHQGSLAKVFLLACVTWLAPDGSHAQAETPDGTTTVRDACIRVERLMFQRAPTPEEVRVVTQILADIEGRRQPIREFEAQFQRLEIVARALDGARWRDMLDQSRPVDSIRVNTPFTQLSAGALARSGSRAQLASLMWKRASEVRPEDIVLAQRFNRAALAIYVADWLELGSGLGSAVDRATKAGQTVASFFGVEPAVALELSQSANAIGKSSRTAVDLMSSSAISADLVIKAAQRSELTDRALNQALRDWVAFMEAAAASDEFTAWTAANIGWRLRSAVALASDQQRLARVDAAVRSVSESIRTQPPRRWTEEILTTPPQPPANSGVRVVTDPNDERIKGVPPQ